MSERSCSGTCRDCLSRREFLARSAGGAALAALAACVGGPTIPKSGRVEVQVAAFPALATVGKLVKVGESQVAKRTGASTFEAYSMFCTHAGCATFLNGQQLQCPCHGSVFSNTGAVLQGPASRALTVLPTSYDPGTDTLTIN